MSTVNESVELQGTRLKLIKDSQVVIHQLSGNWPEDLSSIVWPHTAHMSRVPLSWSPGTLIRCMRDGSVIGTIRIIDSNTDSITYEPVGD